MKIQTTYQRKRARIEIIPLIDIIFFLLATFVMVSMSMVKNEGISVNLPTTSTSQALDRSMTKTITVDSGGNVFLDQELLDVDSLMARLKRLKQQGQDISVIINGDKGADFGVVVGVLDGLRKEGMVKIAIQTRTEAK